MRMSLYDTGILIDTIIQQKYWKYFNLGNRYPNLHYCLLDHVQFVDVLSRLSGTKSFTLIFPVAGVFGVSCFGSYSAVSS